MNKKSADELISGVEDTSAAPPVAPRACAVKTRQKKSCASVREEKLTYAYKSQYAADLLAFFDVPPFRVTEVMKKDGSVSLLETASELPTFAAFARRIGVTQACLLQWEKEHPAFAQAARKARDLQGDILIQNSLRGNYSSSFAVFTAKNILGWTDGKEETKKPERPLVIKWEE